MSIHESSPIKTSDSVAEYVENGVMELRPQMTGYDNAITTGEIADRMGIRRTQTNEKVRLACKTLLEKGHPLISCHNGMYFAESEQEIDMWIESMRVRATGIYRDIEYARLAKVNIPGHVSQPTLFDDLRRFD